MRLSDIESMEKDVLLPAEIAPLLEIDPQDLRDQAQHDQMKLGFPVIVTGTRVRIPRLGFIHYMKYGNLIISEVTTQ